MVNLLKHTSTEACHVADFGKKTIEKLTHMINNLDVDQFMIVTLDNRGLLETIPESFTTYIEKQQKHKVTVFYTVDMLSDNEQHGYIIQRLYP